MTELKPRQLYQRRVTEFLGDRMSLMLICLEMNIPAELCVVSLSVALRKLRCFGAKIGALWSGASPTLWFFDLIGTYNLVIPAGLFWYFDVNWIRLNRHCWLETPATPMKEKALITRSLSLFGRSTNVCLFFDFSPICPERFKMIKIGKGGIWHEALEPLLDLNGHILSKISKSIAKEPKTHTIVPTQTVLS